MEHASNFEPRVESGLGNYESAIRKFLQLQYGKDREQTRVSYPDRAFDVSHPKSEDLDAVRSGNFEISHFRLSPTTDPHRQSFNFYVGGTEFNVTGAAADKIRELME